MRGPDTPFSPGEYARRIALVRAAMDRRGLDLILATDPSNQAWLTGYDGWSFYVHQGVLLAMEGDPVWWGRRMDAAGGRRTCWMEDARVLGYSDDYVQSDERHPMHDLAARIREMGLERARIGVEMENYYYSARADAVLRGELPEADFADATALVNWQRIVKSDEEIAFMRKAARISERMVRTAIERAEPGVRKNDLVADVVHAGIEGADGAWGDYPAIVPLAPSGADASAAHLTWNGKPMRRGEATFFELSGVYRRYHAPLCRTVFLGAPPQELRAAEAAQLEGIEAGLEAARAGARAGDVADAFMAVLARRGIEREGRMGYPVGLSYPPDWGERTASIRSGDATILAPGMAFHFMPAIWTEGWGLETTETILIRPDGPAEPLCGLERRLFAKP